MCHWTPMESSSYIFWIGHPPKQTPHFMVRGRDCQKRCAHSIHVNIMWFPCSQDSRYNWLQRFKESVVDARTFKIGAINQRFSSCHPWTGCSLLFFSMFLFPMCLHLLFVSNLGLLIFVAIIYIYIYFSLIHACCRSSMSTFITLGVSYSVSLCTWHAEENSWSVCDAQGGDGMWRWPLWWGRRLLKDSSVWCWEFCFLFGEAKATNRMVLRCYQVCNSWIWFMLHCFKQWHSSGKVKVTTNFVRLPVNDWQSFGWSLFSKNLATMSRSSFTGFMSMRMRNLQMVGIMLCSFCDVAGTSCYS